MGKNKSKSAIFKVAGARSLKAKSKAKAVDLNLKKIVPKLREKKLSVDEQFLEVKHIVVKQSSETSAKPPVVKPEIVISRPPLTAEDESATLSKFTELHCE